MTPDPLTSIIISNYNYAQYVEEAIRSALEQRDARVEVIVVDDGSTDNSREVIAGFGDKIHAIFQENKGQPFSFNAAFAVSRGDIICFLDSDDRFNPEKISTLKQAIPQMEKSGPDWFLSHYLNLMDETGQPMGKRKPEQLLGFNREKLGDPEELLCVSRPEIARRFAADYGYIPFLCGTTSSSALSRTMAERIFPIPVTEYRGASDDMVVSASMLLGPVYFLPRPLAQYRVHKKNIRYGREFKPRPDGFLVGRDAYLNGVLKKLGLPAFFSFFESRAAQTYFAYNKKYGKMLLLAFKVVARHISFRSLVFAALTPFKVLRAIFGPHNESNR